MEIAQVVFHRGCAARHQKMLEKALACLESNELVALFRELHFITDPRDVESSPCPLRWLRLETRAKEGIPPWRRFVEVGGDPCEGSKTSPEGGERLCLEKAPIEDGHFWQGDELLSTETDSLHRTEAVQVGIGTQEAPVRLRIKRVLDGGE
jgi:hypothetical protein